MGDIFLLFDTEDVKTIFGHLHVTFHSTLLRNVKDGGKFLWTTRNLRGSLMLLVLVAARPIPLQSRLRHYTEKCVHLSIYAGP